MRILEKYYIFFHWVREKTTRSKFGWNFDLRLILPITRKCKKEIFEQNENKKFDEALIRILMAGNGSFWKKYFAAKFLNHKVINCYSAHKNSCSTMTNK